MSHTCFEYNQHGTHTHSLTHASHAPQAQHLSFHSRRSHSHYPLRGASGSLNQVCAPLVLSLTATDCSLSAICIRIVIINYLELWMRKHRSGVFAVVRNVDTNKRRQRVCALILGMLTINSAFQFLSWDSARTYPRCLRPVNAICGPRSLAFSAVAWNMYRGGQIILRYPQERL